MPVAGALARDTGVAGPLGSLALSVVRPAVPMMIVRAVRWYRDLARLGMHVPLFLVHDFGMLYAAPIEQMSFGTRGALDAIGAKLPGVAELVKGYRAIVEEIARSEAAMRARGLRLADDRVVVILARVCA